MNFKEEVESNFAFLVQRGFDKPIFEASPVYESVRFNGQNIYIEFTFDIKDDTVDCNIGKIGGNYLSSIYLFNYLVDQKNFPNKFPPLRGKNNMLDLMEVYKKLLVDHADELINDDPTFMP